MLFGDLIVWYLFLGGIGGGTYLVVFALDLFGRAGFRECAEEHRSVEIPVLVGSAAALGFGALCLLKDLARPTEVVLLATRPTPTAISIGSFALGSCLVGVVVLIVLALMGGRKRFPLASLLVGIATAALAAVVVTYAGLLLGAMSSVPLWSPAALPVLLVLSSLSTGLAAVLAITSFKRAAGASAGPVPGRLAACDMIVIVFETLTLVAFVAQLLVGHGMARPVELLVNGAYSLHFWIGFATLGLILPLIMECASAIAGWKSPSYFAAVAVCVLVGGFFLRYWVVHAGVHLSTIMFM